MTFLSCPLWRICKLSCCLVLLYCQRTAHRTAPHTVFIFLQYSRNHWQSKADDGFVLAGETESNAADVIRERQHDALVVAERPPRRSATLERSVKTAPVDSPSVEQSPGGNIRNSDMTRDEAEVYDVATVEIHDGPTRALALLIERGRGQAHCPRKSEGECGSKQNVRLQSSSQYDDDSNPR